MIAGLAVVGLSVLLTACAGSPAEVAAGVATSTVAVASPDASPSSAMPAASPGAGVPGAASPDPSASPLDDEELPGDKELPGDNDLLSDAELLEILPENARYDSLPGAMATAEFFMQEYPRMMSSGDTTVWDSLSLPDCAFCADRQSQAVTTHLAGTTVRGGEITHGPRISEAHLLTDGRVRVTYPVEIADIYISKPHEPEQLAVEQKAGVFYVLCERVGHVWKITGVQGEEP